MSSRHNRSWEQIQAAKEPESLDIYASSAPKKKVGESRTDTRRFVQGTIELSGAEEVSNNRQYAAMRKAGFKAFRRMQQRLS